MLSLFSLSRAGGAGVACALLALGFAPSAAAQASPRGPDFQVNAYTSSYQNAPAVATHGRGDFVVVWESAGSPGTDQSLYSIQARRYSWDAKALAGQVQVNSYVTGNQVAPSVAADSLGRFVVAWWGYGAGDPDQGGIQARRFDAAGAPLTGELQVNNYATSWQDDPAIAMDGEGNFVVVWTSDGSGQTDTSQSSIQARRFGADGTPLGGQFQVNTYTTGNQNAGAVASDPSGGFVVAWRSYGSFGTDTNSSIQARRYDATGAPLAGQFQVNSYTTGIQAAPAIAVDGAGSFVVVWQSGGSAGTDHSGYSVQARRYAASGTPAGEQFQVNTFTSMDQIDPGVAVDARGMFIISWTSWGSDSGDDSGLSIQARRYRASGAALGPQGQVNSFTTGHQELSAVAVDPRGDVVVAWQGNFSGGTDTDYTCIQARVWDGVLRDGFETGDTSRWSSTVP